MVAFGGTYTSTANSTAVAANSTAGWTTFTVWHSNSNTAWVSRAKRRKSTKEPAKPRPEYVKIMPVVIYLDQRQAQTQSTPVETRARSKLLRWKSLKEKRRAWGIA